MSRSIVVLAALAMVLAVPASAGAAGTTASFTKSSDWGSGFVGHYEIRNETSATIRDWKLEFDLPAGERLTNAWNAKLSSSGNHYVLTAEAWTNSIAPGSSVDVGFQGAYSGGFADPSNCTLNGAPCSGGGSSNPDPEEPDDPDDDPGTPTTPDPASTLKAAFTKTSDWGSGFVGSYVIRNEGTAAVNGWQLEFDLPSTVAISAAWSAKLSRSGNHYTLTDESWTHAIAPGSSVKVGFQGAYSGSFADPANCTLNGESCAGGSGSPGDPTEPPDGDGEDDTGSGGEEPADGDGSGATAAGFAPYVDMTLSPFSSIADMSTESGAERLSLAFIVSGASCTASWGGYYGIDDPTIKRRIADLQATGADPIVSFGGAINQELARTCTSVESLAAQYQAVVDEYGIRDLDFDIEGADQSDAASLERRFKAIAQIQAAGLAAGEPVHVSLTLPVLPTGLTHDGLNVVEKAIADGVDVGTVNVMAMDYFDPALDYSGKMGDYAVQAATATHDQLAQLYPDRTDAELWSMVGVTPMIGINDDPNEVFTTADAEKLTSFANQKGLGRLAMWSLNRDGPCPAPTQWTSNTCSGVSDPQWAFSSAFGDFGG